MRNYILAITIGLIATGCGQSGSGGGGGAPAPAPAPQAITVQLLNYSHQTAAGAPSGTTLTISDASIWGPANNINGNPGFHIMNVAVGQGGSAISYQGPGTYRFNILAIEAATGNYYCAQMKQYITASRSYGIRLSAYVLGFCPNSPLP